MMKQRTPTTGVVGVQSQETLHSVEQKNAILVGWRSGKQIDMNNYSNALLI